MQKKLSELLSSISFYAVQKYTLPCLKPEAAFAKQMEKTEIRDKITAERGSMTGSKPVKGD